ncbi:hypothetical protein [Mycobacterium sp.]
MFDEQSESLGTAGFVAHPVLGRPGPDLSVDWGSFIDARLKLREDAQ